MPSVDEKLLAQGEDSADRAGDIREARKDSQRGQSINIEEEDQDNYSKFKQKKQEEKNKNLSKKKLSAKSFNPISPLAISLARLLRQSWILLIKSFGLTLIWINIHVLGNMIFGPKVFCNLGEEWFIRPGMNNNPELRKKAKETGKKTGLLEKMGCGCLNILFFSIVIGVLVIVMWPILVWGKIIEIGIKILDFFGLLE